MRSVAIFPIHVNPVKVYALWTPWAAAISASSEVRPSGTEPKVKLYGEGVDMPRADLESLLESLAALAPPP